MSLYCTHRIYSHESLIMVETAKSLLASAGIESLICNENALSVSGEIPPIEAWVQLKVAPEDVARAEPIIDQWIYTPAGLDWRCDQCDEANADSFEFCWQCSTPR